MYHDFSIILQRTGLWDEERPVLLAVSGGIDSMCMADLFRRTGLGFSIAHCNFHLRGEESDADEAMVRDWASSAGVELHKKDFDTKAHALQTGQSIEMAARELRYRWFAELCQSKAYAALCIAHNANDNAETLFLNLVRGTGLKGLAGMSLEGVLPYSEAGPLRLVRPLLGFTRKQIEGYVRSHSVPYREDRTNSQTDYKRNKIRHLVFPVLEEMNPAFIKTVSAEMARFAQAGAVADAYYLSVRDALLKNLDNGDIVLSLSDLYALDNWEYVLYRVLDEYGFNGSVVEAVTELLKSDRTIAGKYFLSENRVLLTAGNSLIIRRLTLKGRRAFTLDLDRIEEGAEDFVVVRGEGNYSCLGTRFSVSVVDRAKVGSLRQPEGTLIFDASAMTFPFVCRAWKEGDWFVPFGMRGRKKVSDFFTDLKYDNFRKRSAVILVNPACADQRRIAAVLGLRSDDSFKVTERTEKVLIVKILS